MQSIGPAPGWQVRGGRRITPAPFVLAGIVNITPDSFSDGGRFGDPARAMERVRTVIAEGADMVDLGAESTRPGAPDIGFAEEWRRLAPVLTASLALRHSLRHGSAPAADQSPGSQEPDEPFFLSLDTWRAQTALAALEVQEDKGPGLDVINDVSGGSFDPGMDEVLAAYKPGYVLGHSPARPDVMQQAPQYDDVVDALLDWFTRRMNGLVVAGLPEDCIVLDPCIGFGKTLEHTLAIFAAIPRLAALGRPLYFGISRKSFLGALTGLPASGRDSGTQAVTALLASRGVPIHRVHAVAETAATLQIAAAWNNALREQDRQAG